MSRTTVLLTASLSLVLCAGASAAPPQIKDITPSGIRRGEPADVVFSGSNLAGNPRLVAPFASRSEPVKGSDALAWKVKLTVAPEVAVGVYPVRIQTDDGISTRSCSPSVSSRRSPRRRRTAPSSWRSRFPTAAGRRGEVAANDVDFFRFRGRKGQRIVVDAQCARIGSGIDPTIRLTAATARRT